MVDAGLASQRELMKAERNTAEAQGRLEQLQTQADLTHHEHGGLRSIISPIDGYVVLRNANAGMTMTEGYGEPLFTIANIDRVWADLNVYESDMAQLHEGSLVQLSFIAIPDTTINGTIERLSRTVDAESKALVARVRLNNANHRLRPGMFVSAKVQIPINGPCTAVPNSAMLFDEGHNYVVLIVCRCKWSSCYAAPIRSVTYPLLYPLVHR